MPAPGLFAWIGSEGGLQPWKNPATEGEVRITRLENIFGNWIDLETQAVRVRLRARVRTRVRVRVRTRVRVRVSTRVRVRPNPNPKPGGGRERPAARRELPCAELAPRPTPPPRHVS